MNNNKILVVASPWLGGSGSVAYRIAKELDKQGFSVHFLSYQIPFKRLNRETDIHFHKVRGYAYPLFPFPIYELALAEEIAKVVLKNNIKIIHAHYGILFGHASLIAKCILASKNYPIKVVITFHGSDVLGFDLEKPGRVVPKLLNQWLINSADVITVASNSLNASLTSIYGIKRNVIVIPNFVDTNIFRSENSRRKRAKFIHISNLRKVKQPLIVIKIFKKVLEKYPDAKLTIIGDGPEKKAIKKFCRDNKVLNVVLLGTIKKEKELIKHLNNSRILLLPSLYENFPLAVLEAQACGVPVIASNVGGIPEIVVNSQSGYLTEPKNVNAFAKYAIKLLSNDDLWKIFSNNSVINASQYDVKNIVKYYIDIYERIDGQSEQAKHYSFLVS